MKAVDIDNSDWFWSENAQSAFPTVAENVDVALKKYTADMQQITRNNGITSIDQLKEGLESSTNMTAEDLKIAINELPKLTERKRIIDNHLQVATALLDQIRDRDLGNLFLVEHQLQDLTKSNLLSILRKPEQGNATDKMRLFLVFFFSTAEIPPTDLLEYEKALRDAGCEMTVLEAAKKIKAHSRMMQMALSPTKPDSSSSGFMDQFGSFGSKITTGVLGNIVASVKNLLPESTETTLTKQIDLALELATGQPVSASTAAMFRSTSGATVKPSDAFALFDPKSSRASMTSAPQCSFTHVIVFIIGGSNYSEYNHVEEWVRKRSQQQQIPMHTTFGTTDLVTGAEFLNQLSRI